MGAIRGSLSTGRRVRVSDRGSDPSGACGFLAIGEALASGRAAEGLDGRLPGLGNGAMRLEMRRGAKARANVMNETRRGARVARRCALFSRAHGTQPPPKGR